MRRLARKKEIRINFIMLISKKTKICISIAGKPGDFGASVFNAAFRALSLDYIYKPFKVDPEELSNAIRGIRSFGIRGCGVSMPHKIKVMKYLDKIDPVAQKVGAVNTIVNNKNVLFGYNTDFEGIKIALQENYSDIKRVLIIGAGGVARAIILALKEINAGEIYLANRDQNRSRKVVNEFGIKYVPYSERNNFSGDLLINATPVGMPPNTDRSIVSDSSIKKYRAVVDVVVSPTKTHLIKSAEKFGKKTIPGVQISLYQAAKQFKLYTGQNAPLNIMMKSVRDLWNNQNI